MANNANTLGRLNEILFAELERLNALDATDKDALEAEVERSKAVQGVAKEINTSARSARRRTELARERRHLEGHPWTQDVRKAAPSADIDSATTQKPVEGR